MTERQGDGGAAPRPRSRPAPVPAVRGRRVGHPGVVVSVSCPTDGCETRLRFDQPGDDGVLRTACGGCRGTFALDHGDVHTTVPTD
jgi:hypothetical protein